MSDRGRTAMFLVGAAGLIALLLPALLGLPDAIDLGSFVSTYYIETGVTGRQSDNVVSSVIFDYRGADTMIEQLILFAAVTGITLLTRRQPSEHEENARDAVPGRVATATPGAFRLASIVLVGLSVLLAFYINLHPHITPGGGFQTGVLVASGLLGLYLADEFGTYDRLAPVRRLEVVEGLAAASYLTIALLGLFLGGQVLTNFVPLGQLGALYGGGTIWVFNLIIGVEVGAGFVVVFTEFLEQSIRIRDRADT